MVYPQKNAYPNNPPPPVDANCGFPCRDERDDCGDLKARGDCQENVEGLFKDCALTCGTCCVVRADLWLEANGGNGSLFLLHLLGRAPLVLQSVAWFSSSVACLPFFRSLPPLEAAGTSRRRPTARPGRTGASARRSSSPPPTTAGPPASSAGGLRPTPPPRRLAPPLYPLATRPRRALSTLVNRNALPRCLHSGAGIS